MIPKRIKLLFAVILTVLILFTAIAGFYFSRIHFAGTLTLKMKTKKTDDKNISFIAISPLNKEQPFYLDKNGSYILSGYYSHIIINADTAIVSQLTEEDTLFIKLENNNNYIPFSEINKNWTHTTSNEKVCFYLPNSLQKTHFLKKINAVVTHTSFAPAAVIVWYVLFIFIALSVLLWQRFYRISQLLSSHLTKGRVVCLSALLTGLYFFVFITSNNYTDSVTLSGDSWEYQTMGVNQAKGHGIQRLSILEPFDTYLFDKQGVDEESLNNLKILPYDVVDTYRTPAYSVFLGIVYKLFGIHPSAVKIIQLLLLCFVAGFSAWLFYRLWHIKGLYAGLAGGLIFLINYNHLAHDIMTEVLLIFFSFLMVSLTVIFEQKRDMLTGSLLGIVFGLALLTKGMLIFVIAFYLFYQLFLFFRTKEKKLKSAICALFTAFFLGLLPWTIYASSVNKFVLIEPISKTQIITATSQVEAIFKNTDITEKNIIKVIGDINDIYYNNKYWDESRYQFVKDFAKKHPDIIKSSYAQVIDFVKKEVNQFYKEYVNYLALPWFGHKYLYINFNGLTLLTIQPRTLLLESNNEHCTDGGWHKESQYVDYYYKTDNNKAHSLIRVVKFYFKNPQLIFKVFPNKFFSGFKNFLFIQIILLLSLLSLFKNTRTVFFTAFLIVIPVLLLLLRICPPLLFVLCCLLLCIIIWQHTRHFTLFPVSIPLIVKFFLVNIILITFIFYGLDRFTLISEFLVIPLTLLFIALKVKEVLSGYKQRG